jgi:hypothetical protein
MLFAIREWIRLLSWVANLSLIKCQDIVLFDGNTVTCNTEFVRTVESRTLFDDKNAARVLLELERSDVVRFVVQLGCRFDDQWFPVVRYDTAHGFAHRDLLRPSGEVEKTDLAVRDDNEALTFAIQDLRRNWETYGRRCEQWLEEE